MLREPAKKPIRSRPAACEADAIALATRPAQPLRAFMALTCVAVVLWCLLLGFAHTDLTLRTRAAQIAFFFLAFAAFLPGAWLVCRIGQQASVSMVRLVLVVGIGLRLATAPLLAITTSDIYRYLWEGRLVNIGENPYAEPPDSPRLAPLRDEVWRRVHFKSVPAAYPPVAQYVFALADRIPGNRIIALKLLFAAFDIGTVLLLPGLLRGLGQPPICTLLYAWHPLIVGEVVARGHFDSVGIFFLVLALRLATAPSRRSRLFSEAALAASTLAKGYAILTLPFFFASGRWRIWLGLAFFLTAAAAYVPFASAGMEIFRGLRTYSVSWEGYGSVFPLLDSTLAPLTQAHAPAARVVCGVLLAGWVFALLAKRTLSQFDSCFFALAGFFVLSPVLYPWYLSWTVPFLCLRPRAPWLVFTGTVFLFYAQGYAGSHATIPWVTALEYGTPLAIAVALVLKRQISVRPHNAREKRAAISP